VERAGAPPGSGGEAGAPSPAVPKGLRRQRRRSSEGGRKKAKEFLDVADQAFVHQVAVTVWRGAEEVLALSGSRAEGIERLRGAGDFEDRGAFAPLWRKNWLEALDRLAAAAGPPERLGVLREMVVRSVDEEEEARRRAGLPRLVDEEEGQRFIDFAMDRLFEEASGEIEEEV